MTTPDDPTPDTAMASGSDAGGPGGRLGPGDLSPDEERLLAALERGGAPRGTTFREETQEAVSAAADELPLPAEGAVPDDGLTPSFRAPETD
ncbi:MAG: hypothetical protein AVDCRST_MAG57-164 [uncultured Blastococcus sp.]|uniref:Uncharacterized protein n=1 Tax=uncultured Blastococcus sp. TaxID=217144 RepID=A0A6J4H2R0_9ACTN|nr:MAG: hypothetical protein AVDCRST_MAG57-164 [uncultured Blastococcus sp.]